MSEQHPINPERARLNAVSRWENEGGATATGREQHSRSSNVKNYIRRLMMRIIDYFKKEKRSIGENEVVATDKAMDEKFGTLQHAYEEGFASADGVRGGTAVTDGRVKHPEKGDDTNPKRTPDSIENENPGLADN